MLALDGLDVRGEKEAAAALGIRGSTFPARKALDQSRRLGHDKIAQAIALLARADRDLRGERAYPRDVADDLVMELLIAGWRISVGRLARPATSYVSAEALLMRFCKRDLRGRRRSCG